MFHRRKSYRLGTTWGWVNEHSLINLLRSSDNIYLLLTFSMCLHNHCRTGYLATASLFKQVTKSQKCSLVLFFSPLWASVEVLLGERGELSQMRLCKELCGRQRERESEAKCRRREMQKEERGTNWKKEWEEGVMCKKRGQCSWQANKTCRELQRKWAFYSAHTYKLTLPHPIKHTKTLTQNSSIYIKGCQKSVKKAMSKHFKQFLR